MVTRRARLILLLSLAALFFALPTVHVHAQDVYSERTLELGRELECPVCAGQSVAESQSTLAKQMRGIIEQKVQAGESDEAIKQYFVDRYGTAVLRSPPRSGLSLGLWWMPVVVVGIGALVVGLYLKERTHPVNGSPFAEEDEDLELLARDILGADDSRPEGSTSS